ncbi:MAG: hypothetical protein ACSLFN_00360 [Candidatus Limnocylindrales bacterium]
MSDRDDALRATTDDIKADTDELHEIEETKASMDPDDPRQDALAERAQDIARELVPKTTAQREIVSEAR